MGQCAEPEHRALGCLRHGEQGQVCKMGQCAEPEHRGRGCLRHGEQGHLYLVYKTQGPQE